MKLYAFLLGLILLEHTYSLNCPTGSYFSSSSRSCTACPKGYSCAGDNYAIQCKPGYYADKVRSSSCSICPVGHCCYYVDVTPRKCPKGEYQDNRGQRFCKGCRGGEYNVKTGQTKCKVCPLGHKCYYINEPPVKCPKGEYQNLPGQRFCKNCKGGQYNVKYGQTGCHTCPVGHKCYYNNVAPVRCPKGEYQDQRGQRVCKNCKGGHYNVKYGQTRCHSCPVGHHCYYNNVAPVRCPKGKYQDRPGQRFCYWCKGGDYNIKYGQKKCKTCPLGHSCYYFNVAPVKCPKGKYQDRRGQRSCKWCKAGRYNLRKGRSTTCKSCPAGSMCPYVDAPPIRCSQGTYSPPESKTCFSCPSGTLCPRPYLQPLQPSKDAALKSKIHNVAKFAADAYNNKGDSSLNGLRLLDSKNRIRGFVKYDRNTIIVSFRGTKGLNAWVNNAKFLKRTYKACPGCKIHTGFSRYYCSIRSQMFTKVSGLSHAHPSSKVIVTGHSLGGGLATLAAVELAKAGYTTDLITYGAPRVGNDKFAKYADKTLKGLNLRVTYKNDIVTVTPPQLIGYRHAGQEMHYMDFNTGYKLPPNTDIDYNRLSFGDHKMSVYEKLK